jgi:S-adenosylmethionine-diacylgycerolhomoserine-N-methlytransferase
VSAFASADKGEHRSFLNRYYGLTRHIYDATRKYYLLGRDVLLEQLAREPGWSRLIEVGPGTGRNLVMLHKRRPAGTYGGVEASDAMLEHARGKAPFATLVHGFAEDADLAGLLGARPDRVMFSYCLSMVSDPQAALRNARRSLAQGGEVVVVDFADLGGLPGPLQRGLGRWLKTFHVEPLDLRVFDGHDARIQFGPGHYYVIARMGPLPPD